MRLLSAVFTKEMVTLSRRKNQYVARALLLGALLGAIWFNWSSGMREMGSFADMSYLGHKLFGVFALFQLGAILILTPAFTAPVIATEKDQKTLGLLLMSNLSYRQVLLDKLLSRLVILFLLILAGLPLFLVLLPFGGVSTADIYSLYSVSTACVLFCAGAGLFFSTVMSKMYSALIATYACVFACGFALADYDIAHDRYNILYGLAFFLASLLTCIILLPRIAEREPRQPLKRLFRWLNKFFHRINFTGVTVMKEHKVPERNAMLWKETHKQFYTSNIFLLRSFAVMLMLSIVAFAALIFFEVDMEQFLRYFAWLGLLITFAIAIVGSSVAFASEREKHTFEILLTTPIKAHQIIMAKFRGVFKLSLPPLFCVIIVTIVGNEFLVNHQHFSAGELIAMVSNTIGYHIPVLVAIGLYSSLKRKRIATAILQTFLVCTAICLLSLLMSHPILRQPQVSCCFGSEPITHDSWLAFSPLGSLLSFGSRYSRIEIGYLSLLYSPVWIILLLFLIHRFDRITGRQ